jgi:hypothetical protein
VRFLTIKGKPQKLTTGFNYKIADAIYCSNDLVPELRSFLIDKTCVKYQSSSRNSSSETTFAQLVYDQSTNVGERLYNLQVKTNKDNDYLLTAGCDDYQILKDSITSPDKTDPIILLGPALILNLAINNVFCFHASACVMNDKVFIFLAASGTGKSTIARFIGESANAYRIADDIVPVKIINDQTTLLTNFPQLKLTTKQHYNGQPINKKVHFMFITKDTNAKVSLSLLNAIETLKNLISHSIATRLFNAQHLKNHLDFCYQLSLQSTCYQVSYQHNSNSLPEFLELLDAL